MNGTDTIQRLKATGSTDTFAQSLIASYERNGFLSDKQWAWVDKLADRAEAALTQPTVAIGDFGPMVALFDNASAAGLKFPKIRLDVDSGMPLVLAKCGSRSKHEGAIRATNGAGFNDPDNRYFGMIDTDGRWVPGRDATPAVVNMLKAFAADPEGVAAAYGQRTGSCCFCNRTLTDERSTDVGYGPICSDKFGLTWG